MVEYSQGEIRQIARRFGTSPGVIQRMAEAEVLDKVQALNENGIPEGWITLAHAADLVGRSYRTLERWAKAGVISTQKRPGSGWGGQVFINQQELLEFAKEPLKTGPPRKLRQTTP